MKQPEEIAIADLSRVIGGGKSRGGGLWGFLGGLAWDSRQEIADAVGRGKDAYADAIDAGADMSHAHM